VKSVANGFDCKDKEASQKVNAFTQRSCPGARMNTNRSKAVWVQVFNQCKFVKSVANDFDCKDKEASQKVNAFTQRSCPGVRMTDKTLRLLISGNQCASVANGLSFECKSAEASHE